MQGVRIPLHFLKGERMEALGKFKPFYDWAYKIVMVICKLPEARISV